MKVLARRVPFAEAPPKVLLPQILVRARLTPCRLYASLLRPFSWSSVDLVNATRPFYDVQQLFRKRERLCLLLP